MKKLITGLVLGAMCCVLFSAPAVSIKYNPNNPVYQTHDAESSTRDETGWGEPVTSSSSGNQGIIGSYSSIFLYLGVSFHTGFGPFWDNIWRFIVPSTQEDTLIHETTSGDRVNQGGQGASR